MCQENISIILLLSVEILFHLSLQLLAKHLLRITATGFRYTENTFETLVSCQPCI